MPAGFVYVLTNRSMQGLVKIGGTEKHPAIRAAELSDHAGVPAAFEVVFFAGVVDWELAERRVHDALAAHRVPSGREFFGLDAGEAARTIRAVTTELGGLAHEGQLVLGDALDHDLTASRCRCGASLVYIASRGEWVCRNGHEPRS